MSFDNVRFTKEHEWVRFEKSGNLAAVGITDFAAGELGDIVYIEFPEIGREVKASDPMGTIEAVKTVADLYAPVSGIVKEVNTALNDDPAAVNQSPYDKGWFVKLELTDRSELDGLMNKSDYDKMVGKD
jgi:glycine cleavage system H protein